MILKLIDTKIDLLKEFNQTKNFPELLPIHYSIEGILIDHIPEIHQFLYTYENKHGQKLWIVFRDSETCQRYVTMYSKLDSKFEDADLFEVFNFFEKEHPKLFLVGTGSAMIVMNPLMDSYKRWINKRTRRVNEFYEFRQQYFYMTDEQMEETMMVDIKMPEGYYLAEADLEMDPEEMCRMMRAPNGVAKNPTDLPQNRVQLKHLPYALIKTDDDELVGFEMVDPMYVLRNQFVRKDHRGLGLGNIVERKLCQKLIRMGKTPFKLVIRSNTPVIEASMRSKFWTTLEHDGQIVENIVVRSFKPILHEL